MGNFLLPVRKTKALIELTVQEYAVGNTAWKQKSSAFKFPEPSFNCVFYRYVISIEQYITQ